MVPVAPFTPSHKAKAPRNAGFLLAACCKTLQALYNVVSILITGVSARMKPFAASKVNWAGLIIALLGILQILQEWYVKGDFSIPGIITLVMGILVVILRTFYTDTPINTPKARAAQQYTDVWHNPES